METWQVISSYYSPSPCTSTVHAQLTWFTFCSFVKEEQRGEGSKFLFFNWFIYLLQKEKCKEKKWKYLHILSISINGALAVLLYAKWILLYQARQSFPY